MTDKRTDESPSVTDALSSSLDSARATAERGVAELQRGADELLKQAAAALVSGGAVASSTLREGLSEAQKLADEAKVHANAGFAQYKAAEDAVFAQIKAGVAVVHSNPYLSYPLLTTGALLVLPGTRRLLYRATLGRLRSVDSILAGSEGKVDGLRTKMGDLSAEAKKLQDRLLAAEEEYLRGRQKLKATRQELQRLASVVAKSERAAAGVLDDLRAIKKVDKAVSLRAEAAQQVSALKAQRTALQQYIYRIASKDI